MNYVESILFKGFIIESIRFHRAAATSSCMSLDMGARNLTQVPCKRPKYSSPLSISLTLEHLNRIFFFRAWDLKWKNEWVVSRKDFHKTCFFSPVVQAVQKMARMYPSQTCFPCWCSLPSSLTARTESSSLLKVCVHLWPSEESRSELCTCCTSCRAEPPYSDYFRM